MSEIICLNPRRNKLNAVSQDILSAFELLNHCSLLLGMEQVHAEKIA